MSEAQAHEAVARVHREEWARVVAGLTRRFSDLDIAEAFKQATVQQGSHVLGAQVGPRSGCDPAGAGKAQVARGQRVA